MRGALAALAVCLVLPALAIPSNAVAAGGSTGTAIGQPGYYWPVNRIRALDTRVSGAIAAGATTKVRVTGPGLLPATGVVAASVNLTVLTPAVTGSLSVFADGTSFSGATMSFQAGQTNQNFETVPVTATGLIDIRNNTAGSLTLILDILGYHAYQALGDHYYGWYQPMTPARLLDTRAGQPVAAGQTRTFQVGGQAGIPSSNGDGVAVAVNFTVLTPSRSGSLSVSTDLATETASISFAAGHTEQGQLLVLLDSDGGLPIRNNSAAAIQVIADVVGYYTGVNVFDPAVVDHLDVGGHYRVYDSRIAGDGPVPPGGTIELPIADLENGNTKYGICAPLLNFTVLTPSTADSISAWPDSVPWDGAATVSFAAHQTRQRQLMVKGGESHDVQLRNNSSAPITLIVDGWRSYA